MSRWARASPSSPPAPSRRARPPGPGEDYRFTRSKDGNTVFAFRMREGRTRIVSLGRVYERPVRQVSVYGQPVPFVQKDGCLDVSAPENRHPGMPQCIRVDF